MSLELPPPNPLLFPYTTLFRSIAGLVMAAINDFRARADIMKAVGWGTLGIVVGMLFASLTEMLDRKSTRLNSSHVEISYAVFCLKKKNRRHEGLLTFRIHHLRP